MNMKKRIPAYILGMLILALGIVLVTKANIGIAPASCIPYTLFVLFPFFTFGTWTSLFHFLCVLAQLVVMRRLTVKLVLQIPLAYVFGKIIDLFGILLNFTATSFAMGLLVLFGAILCLCFGISIVAGADLMLPPPDAMLRTISAKSSWPMGRTKFVGDICFVLSAIVLSSILVQTPLLVIGVATVLCMLLTGNGVSLIQRLMPFLDLRVKAPQEAPAPDFSGTKTT